MAGPLLGVALLGWAQGRQWTDPAGAFRFVFWLTLVPGVLAVVAFLALVRDPEHSPNPGLTFAGALHALPARFKRYLVPLACSGRATSHTAALAFAAHAESIVVLAALFFVAGLHVAVQEALESAVTASMVDADTLATTYGALGVVNGAAKFTSSAALGVLWTAVSPAFAFGAAALVMAMGTMALTRTRVGTRFDQLFSGWSHRTELAV